MPIFDADPKTTRWGEAICRVETDWTGDECIGLQFELEAPWDDTRRGVLLCYVQYPDVCSTLRERLKMAWTWLRHGKQDYMDIIGLEKATVAGLARRLAEVAERMEGRE
jgi:hypothetical protein